MPFSVLIHLQNHAQRRESENDVRYLMLRSVSDVTSVNKCWRKQELGAIFQSYSLASHTKISIIPHKLFSDIDRSKVNHIWLSITQFIQQNRH